MNKFLILSKILLKNTFFPINTSKKNYKKHILLLAFLPLMFGIFSLVSKLYVLFESIDQESLILVLGFSIVSMATFYFGIFFMVSVFYFSDDTDNLLFLPIRPFQIIGSKFLIALTYEYITGILLLGPILISFGFSSNASIVYYLYSIIIFFFLPIIPLVLAGIISMTVMRFTSIFKNRDKFRKLGGIISILLAIGLNFSIQNFSTKNLTTQKILEIIDQGNNSLLVLSSKLFPSIKLAILSLINNLNLIGVLNLLLFLFANFIAVFIFLYVGEKIYLKGILRISDTSTKNKEISLQILEKISKKHSKIFSYILKELKIMFRTPAYFMNCVIMNFLWPLFLIIPFVVDNKLIDNINKINILLKVPKVHGIIIAGAFALGAFMASTNSITSTAISREGKTFFVNKFLAIDYKYQIIAKIIPGIIMSLIGTSLILIMSLWVFSIPIQLVIIMIIFGLLGIVLSSMIGIVFDIISPKLIWDNEQKAVKQNMNVLFHTLLGFGIGYGAVFLIYFYALNIINTVLLLGFFSLILIFLVYYFLTTKGIKMYENIES